MLEKAYSLKFWIPVIVFVLLSAYSFNFLVFAMDEYTYMNAAEAFRTGDLALTLEGELGRFPLFPAALSFFYPPFGTELGGKLFNLLAGALGVAATYFLARRLFGEKAAFWSALVLAANPFYVFLSSRVLTEPLFFLLLVVDAYFIYRAEKEERWLVAVGFCTGLLVLTRFIGAYMGLVAFAYFWRNGKLKALAGKWALAGIAAFALAFVPYLWFSQALTGDAFKLLAEFFRAMIGVRQGSLGLPDKIPSYFLALPFVLAFASPLFALGAWKLRERLAEKNVFFVSAAVIVIVTVMEVWGLFNFALLRYIVAVVPFAAMMTGAYVAEGHGKRMKATAALLIALNAAASLAAVYYAATNYQKHEAYAEAGKFAAQYCADKTVFTNVPAVFTHFLHRPVGYDAADTAGGIRSGCVFVSGYDAFPFERDFDRGAYDKAYDRLGIEGFVRKQSK